MEEEETPDLFATPELLPIEVQKVLDEFTENWEYTYAMCTAMQERLEAIGYTFDWYLNAEPYNLRKIEAN